MPRGKKIVIETEINDDVVDKFRRIDVESIKRDWESTEKGLSASLATVFKAAQELYKQKAEGEAICSSYKLYSVKDAYDYLRDKGLILSFRAFGGRIERGTVPYIKLGRKRYIPQSVLEKIVNTKKEFYTVREAFQEYKKANEKINFRAFIGRVEKGSVPSIKLGTRRLVPKDAIDALTHVSRNYYSVTEALQNLHKAGIKIRRNAFERRLDRNRIPHEKIGGRRFVHEKVLRELIDKELALKKQKALKYSGEAPSAPRA
ncbi:MAG: hypothetical protein QXT05_00250 [Candidatus Bilamarchaeaceae archaeon]